jgi:hypothetical protein
VSDNPVAGGTVAERSLEKPLARMKSWEPAMGTRQMFLLTLRIPLKVGGDSDLNPVTGSGAKPGVFGAQRRWRSYGA